MPACDEIIHLGPQIDGLGNCCGYEMEPGVFEFRVLSVFLCKVLINLSKVKSLS